MIPLSHEEMEEMVAEAMRQCYDVLATEDKKEEQPEPKKFIKINLLKPKIKKKTKVPYKDLRDIVESQQ